MRRDIIYTHAVFLASRAGEDNATYRRVNEDGILSTTIDLDCKALRLKAGRPQEVRIVPFAPAKANRAPEPYDLGHGKAAAIIVQVCPEAGEASRTVEVHAELPALAGQWALLVCERVGAPYARVAVAGAAMLALAAGLALASWADPSAKKGHYEGKTQEEIQADLSADVASYAMEISVASAMRVPEGETTVEARIENPVANHCDQKVRILAADGEVLFESGAISPGEYLETVDLARPLDIGTHTLTVEFQGYEQAPTLVSDEGVFLGHDTFGASCAAQVELTVVPREA